MTLTHDLERLAAAGRIRSAWLPGMLSANGYRCLAKDESWSHVADGCGDADSGGTNMGASSSCRLYDPDLTDPATLGCLLALVREAWEDPTLSLVYDHDADTDSEQRHWCVCRVEPDGLAYRGSPEQTEATALTAAIHAAAEGLGEVGA